MTKVNNKYELTLTLSKVKAEALVRALACYCRCKEEALSDRFSKQGLRRYQTAKSLKQDVWELLNRANDAKDTFNP